MICLRIVARRQRATGFADVDFCNEKARLCIGLKRNALARRIDDARRRFLKGKGVVDARKEDFVFERAAHHGVLEKRVSLSAPLAETAAFPVAAGAMRMKHNGGAAPRRPANRLGVPESFVTDADSECNS